MTDLATIAGRRVQGTFEIDPWGLDIDLLTALAPVAGVRWSISVEGAELLADGPALLLAPHRLLALVAEAFVIGAAVLRETGRPLRVLGIPDVAPIGPLFRRLGGAVEHPAEAASLLRAGHLVLSRHDFEVRSLGIGAASDAPTVHVRTQGWELGRRWRVAFSVH